MKKLYKQYNPVVFEEIYKYFISDEYLDRENEAKEYQQFCETMGMNPHCLKFCMQMVIHNVGGNPICLFHHGIELGFLLAQKQLKQQDEINELNRIMNHGTTT